MCKIKEMFLLKWFAYRIDQKFDRATNVIQFEHINALFVPFGEYCNVSTHYFDNTKFDESIERSEPASRDYVAINMTIKATY